MKKKKKKQTQQTLQPRLPMSRVEFLKTHGGFHSTKKGKKGYNRKQQKRRFKNGKHK